MAGADFSDADIRGCNFRGAILTGVTFARCTAGHSRKGIICTGVFSIVVAVIVSLFYPFISLVTVFIAAFYPETTAKILFPLFFTFNISIGVVSAVSVVVFAISAISAFASGAIWQGIGQTVLLLIALYIANLSLSHTQKFFRNEPGTTFFGAELSGATFSNAKLYHVDFTGANLMGVNWTKATFHHCRFWSSLVDEQVRNLCTTRQARNQHLQGKDLRGLHLVGVDLSDANLTGADLGGADLRHAQLERTQLVQVQALGTNFAEAKLTGACIQQWGINTDTDFTNVHCDYVYLEAPDRERKPASGMFEPGDFEKVVMQFAKTLDFLFRNGVDAAAFNAALEKLEAKYRAAGAKGKSIDDLGDGIQKISFTVNPDTNTTELHYETMREYAAIHQELVAARQHIADLESQLVHAPNTEEVARLQQEVANLTGRLDERRQIGAFLEKVFYDKLSNPTVQMNNPQITGNIMPTENTQIQTGDIQGDQSLVGGDNSGVVGKDQQGVAGGDISGTVTVTIEQLQQATTPEAVELADALKQLQIAIQQPSAGLSDKDKEKALKHLEAIGKLGQDKGNPDLLEKAADALDALPTVMKRGAGLAEFCERQLPTITAIVRKLLGL